MSEPTSWRCTACGATFSKPGSIAPDASEPSGEEIVEVSPGTYMTPLRDAAEHLFRDLTNGWVITSQNGLIDCIEEHLRALLSPESPKEQV